MLTFCLQTDLATRLDVEDPAVLQATSATHAKVSNSGASEDGRDILGTDTIPPAVDRGSVRPHKILSDKPADDHMGASDIHRLTLNSLEDDGDRYRAVSIPLTCPSLGSSGSSPLA